MTDNDQCREQFEEWKESYRQTEIDNLKAQNRRMRERLKIRDTRDKDGNLNWYGEDEIDRLRDEIDRLREQIKKLQSELDAFSELADGYLKDNQQLRADLNTERNRRGAK